jgi:osmotically-inducible protein OsmY
VNLRTGVFVCLLAAAVPALGVQRAPVRQAPPAAKPAGKSDSELEAAIRARFAKSKISADNFQVRVQGGVATIEGSAQVIQHKGTATRLARLAGAKEVVNRITITEEARAKAAANLAQGRRRAQVKRSEPRTQEGRNR